MTAKIKTPHGEAVCEGYEWHCEDKVIERYLNSLLNPMGPGGEDPNPDLTAAEQALEEIPDSELVDYTPMNRVEGVVY